MATYGIQTVPGQVPWTGYSNTLGAGPANAPTTSGYVAFNGIQQADSKLAMVFRNGATGVGIKALWIALTGAAPGGSAVGVQKRVGAQIDATDMGGIRPVVTINWQVRNTTAADATAFIALLNRVVGPASYPPDLSGNGGGGKQSNGAY